MRKANPRKKRNPVDESAAAAALSESFHGRPVKKIEEIREDFHERYDLAKLGKLLGLAVWVDEDDCRTLGWVDDSQSENDRMRGIALAASPDGGQLYFVGGDQKLDLHALGLDRNLPKDYIVVGPVQTIAYHTSKDFHNFEPINYVHEFGEEGGEQPILLYDTLSNKFSLSGGSYQVRREGIVD